MCLIVNANPGKTVITLKDFERWTVSNPDGIGVMAMDNDKKKVRVYKTLHDVQDAFNFWNKHDKFERIAHFRWATLGEVTIKNAHPYMVCRDSDYVVWLAHNGVFFEYYMVETGEASDTAMFVKDALAPIFKKDPFALYDDRRRSIIQTLCGGQKIVICDSFGMVWRIGYWYQDDGIYYSNPSYKKFEKKYKWNNLGNGVMENIRLIRANSRKEKKEEEDIYSRYGG